MNMCTVFWKMFTCMAFMALAHSGPEGGTCGHAVLLLLAPVALLGILLPFGLCMVDEQQHAHYAEGGVIC